MKWKRRKMIVYKIFEIIVLCSYFSFVHSHQMNKSMDQKPNEKLHTVIQSFIKEFEVLKSEELEILNINNLYNSSKLKKKSSNAFMKVEELSEDMRHNLGVIEEALEKAKINLDNNNGTNSLKTDQFLVEPCGDSSEEDDMPKYESNEVVRSLYNGLSSIKSSLKQVYLISFLENTPLDEPHSDDRCSDVNDMIPWKNFMSHNMYTQRRVILLIDHGNSIEESALKLSKQFAKQMIYVLENSDKFTVIAIAAMWSSLPVNEDCGNEHLPSILSATNNNKELTYNFIDRLNSRAEVTDHNAGMKIAVKMARLFYAGDEIVMMVYISPGMEFPMSEALDIVSMSDLTSPLVINTCAVASGPDVPDVQDMKVLPDVISDFFLDKNKNSKLIPRGRLVVVSDEHSIGPTVTGFYEIYNKRVYDKNLKLSLPTWDESSKDLFVSISIGFPIGKRFIVIAVDIFLEALLKDIIYFTYYQKDKYAILLTSKGEVILHPNIPIENQKKQIKFADISKFIEKNFPVKALFEKTKGAYYSEVTSLKYTWYHIRNMYILCIVMKDSQELPTISTVNWLANTQLVPYLLNLDESRTLCKSLEQTVNFDSASLYLSPNCFQNLFPKMKRLYGFKVKYNDLQERVREELSGLVKIVDLLKKRHINSHNKEYVVRRYIATKSGILHTFPGISINSDFEPSKRFWFIRADQLRERLIVSPPYLDAGGAGYIVTLSYSTPYIVIGVDVTYGYILRMILKQYPDCSNNTCFLVDDRGYLISHPDLMVSLDSENEPIEQLHIAHKESSVANDILNHERLVEKVACNDYTSATIQRYYQLNMSYVGMFSGEVLGEPCVSYSISSIKNTNIFFGIVRAACPITRTFCPCSVIDRLCLNCQRMEEQECECPCECPINRSSCTNYTSHDDYDLCKMSLEPYSSDPVFNNNNNEDIEQCPAFSCENKPDYFSCLGVLGCEWCRKDAYGYFLDTPFCTQMSLCFNGILSGPSPYKGHSVETLNMFSSVRNAGLILGLIIVFGMVIILIFICWRSQNTQLSQNAYLSARQDEQLRMSDLNINDEFLEQGNHSDKLLIEEKKYPPMSPYCVSSNYSRQATAADSDHGYSTMTPHEESEHLSVAPMEIDSLEEDITSDNPTPPIKYETFLTKVPHKNCIVVPVTVHRNIDAT